MEQNLRMEFCLSYIYPIIENSGEFYSHLVKTVLIIYKYQNLIKIKNNDLLNIIYNQFFFI